MELKLPANMTPDELFFVRLFQESGGKCVVSKNQCAGQYVSTAITTCRWSREECDNPLAPGTMCTRAQKRDPGLPAWPCETVTEVLRSRWKCAWGDYPCYSAVTFMTQSLPPRQIVIGELFFGIPPDFREAIRATFEDKSEGELLAMEKVYGKGFRWPKDYMTILVREWSNLHRSLKEEQWRAEQKAMHDLGERPGPVRRGRFGSISTEIYQPEQFYIKAYELAPDVHGQMIPVAKVELATSSEWVPDISDPTKGKWAPKVLLVDISQATKNISRSARNKAIRYGKPLPEPNQLDVEKIVSKAVLDYLK